MSNDSIDGVDFISSLPDAILQEILSYIPTKFAIRTSRLSRRWRHVWCDTPSLSINTSRVATSSITRTLSNFSAPKITSFHLCTRLLSSRTHDVNSWIEFALSRNPENLSLRFGNSRLREYDFPDFFFTNSSLQQLCIDSGSIDLIPRCTVSWISLRDLTLACVNLSDESIAQILSGCPVLESLKLECCDSLSSLDLSKSLCLTKLEIERTIRVTGPIQIVAPHIHYLKLRNSQSPFTLVDVSSLMEANLDFYCYEFVHLKAVFLQSLVLKMLEKLQNVEKFTFGATFLQILSLAELSGVSFPTLKVKELTLETMILRSVLPGISKLLQNCPCLKKLTIHTVKCRIISDWRLNNSLKRQGLRPGECWRSEDVIFPNSFEAMAILEGKDADPKLVALFIEKLVKERTRVERLVLCLGGYLNEARFDELLKMIPMVSCNNNVLIVVKQSQVKYS